MILNLWITSDGILAIARGEEPQAHHFHVMDDETDMSKSSTPWHLARRIETDDLSYPDRDSAVAASVAAIARHYGNHTKDVSMTDDRIATRTVHRTTDGKDHDTIDEAVRHQAQVDRIDALRPVADKIVGLCKGGIHAASYDDRGNVVLFLEQADDVLEFLIQVDEISAQLSAERMRDRMRVQGPEAAPMGDPHRDYTLEPSKHHCDAWPRCGCPSTDECVRR